MLISKKLQKLKNSYIFSLKNFFFILVLLRVVKKNIRNFNNFIFAIINIKIVPI